MLAMFFYGEVQVLCSVIVLLWVEVMVEVLIILSSNHRILLPIYSISSSAIYNHRYGESGG